MRATKIVFVLLPKVHLQDLAGPAQVFFEATELGNGNFEIHFASCGDGIHSSQGLLLQPQSTPESLELQKGDLICIPGFDFKSYLAGELDDAIFQIHDWIHAQHIKGVMVASICSGSLALGKLGLLDHVTCTSHWKCIEHMKTQFPFARVVENRLYVFDKDIFTSAGMTSGIDMALALVERWRSPLLAAKVAQEMVINMRREDTTTQQNTFVDFEKHFNSDVYRIQEILANRLDVGFTISDLAKEMHMSSRHLSRLFRIQMGETVQSYRDYLRLRHGEQLLLHSGMPIKEIALACGFENTRQFSRLWKKRRQCTPGEFRSTAALAH